MSIRVGHLLPGSELLPPLLELQAVLLVQLLQLLCLMLDEQVALFILAHSQRDATRCSQGEASSLALDELVTGDKLQQA